MRSITFTLFAIMGFIISSCQSNEEITREIKSNINFSFTENTVWHNTSRADATTEDIYYVIDDNGLCQAAAKVSHNEQAKVDKLLAIGNYNVFSITNANSSGLPFDASMLGTDFTNQSMVLNTLTDICLGQQPLSIVASKTNYDINVTVSHVLAKLALSISNVPDDIASIAVTLTNISKTFILDGTFAEDGTTYTLQLEKSATANADGTHSWTLPESLIYPCPTAATTTAINIVATDTYGHATTYTTSSATVCSSGTRTSLTTTWRTLTNHFSYGNTETPWTETIQQGSFDM